MASMKSFRLKAEGATPRDEGAGDPLGHGTPSLRTTQPDVTKQHRNAEVDFRGELPSNATHVSTNDPKVRPYRKAPGTGAILCFISHALMERRCGLIVQGDLTQADGHARRRSALDMIHRHSPVSTRRLTHGSTRATQPPTSSCLAEIAPFSDRRPDYPPSGLCPVDQTL